MVKKCIICGEEAIYKIKGNSDYYCLECAEENFADLDVLVKVEEEAQRLKEFIKQKISESIAENIVININEETAESVTSNN